jgi:cobalt-zinc-cadmium efflux system outer membrane protein
MQYLFLHLILCLSLFAENLELNLSGKLSESAVIEAVLKYNPSIQSKLKQSLAETARNRQTGLLPNPALTLEFEDFGGSGSASGTDNLASSYKLSQEVFTAGKLGYLRGIGELKTQRSSLKLELQKLKLISDTRRIFITLAILQECISIEQQKQKSLDSLHKLLTKKVEAGDIPPIQLNSTLMESTLSRTELARIKREYKAEKRRLSSLWNQPEPGFTEVLMDLDTTAALPSKKQLQTAIEEYPSLLLEKLNISISERQLELERASRTPNIEVSAGATRFKEEQNHALTLEFTIPLPFSDKNQHPIEEAKNQLAGAKLGLQQHRLELSAECLASLESMNAIQEQIYSYEESILPAAQSVFKGVETGFKVGELDLIHLLNAQQTLLEARKNLIKLKEEFFMHRIFLLEFIPELN